MFKGHTEIKLTNVKTGEVETYEDDNMMTNAIEQLFHPMGIVGNGIIAKDEKFGTNPVSNNFIQQTTGGLLLFDKPLPEDENLTLLPTGVNMVGQGAPVLYSSSTSTAGSYNWDLSGSLYDGHGYRHVWDFTTNYGNGDIASVCLTTARGGKVGSGNLKADGENFYNSGGSYQVNYQGAKELYLANNYNFHDSGVYSAPCYIDGKNNRIVYLKSGLNNNTYFIGSTVAYNNSTSYIEDSQRAINNSIIATHDLQFFTIPFAWNNLSIFDYKATDMTYAGMPRSEYYTVHLDELDELITDAHKTCVTGYNGYRFEYGVHNDEGYIYFSMWISPELSNWQNDYYDILPGDFLNIWKINAETFQVEKYYKIVNNYGVNLLTNNFPKTAGRLLESNTFYEDYSSYNSPSNSMFSASRSHKARVITNDYLYIATRDMGYVLINLEDPSQYDKISFDGREDIINIIGYHTYASYVYKNNILLFTNNYRNYMVKIDTELKTASIVYYPVMSNIVNIDNRNTDTYYGYTYSDIFMIRGIEEPIFAIIYDYHYYDTEYIGLKLFFMPNMLVTINNLPQTIHKTSDQTMQVIYTIVDDRYDTGNT